MVVCRNSHTEMEVSSVSLYSLWDGTAVTVGY